jgi:transcriptional regulator with XRE-family HTH domain
LFFIAALACAIEKQSGDQNLARGKRGKRVKPAGKPARSRAAQDNDAPIDGGVDQERMPTRLRALRLRRQMTLEHVAERIGVTKGFLSQVETGKKGVAILTLIKLARLFHVPITHFFFAEPEDHASLSIVRRAERRAYLGTGHRFEYKYEAVAHRRSGKKMEPFVISPPHTFPPGHFQHPGEEMLFVFKGSLRLEYGKKTIVLNAGDCAYYNGAQKHRCCSVGRGRAQALLIMAVE